MKILLTGITGFVGSFLCERLLENGHEVIGISRKKLKNPLKAKGKLTVLQMDLSQGLDYKKPVDAIVHCAAQSPYNCRGINDYVKNNVLATYSVAEYAKRMRIPNLIYLSSISVYGEVLKPVVDEETEIRNPDMYGMTKLLGENILKENSGTSSLAVLRLPGILGKGAFTPWLAQIFENAKQGKEIKIFNPESLFNNAVHLSDLETVILTLLKKPVKGFEIFTLASNKAMRIKNMISEIIRNSKSASKVRIEKAPKSSFVISIKKAGKMFGYCPMKMEQVLKSIN